MLDIIISYHKRALDSLIEESADYETILKQSQFLDKYITRKMKELIV